jgi:hypothetical protein
MGTQIRIPTLKQIDHLFSEKNIPVFILYIKTCLGGISSSVHPEKYFIMILLFTKNGM